MKLSARSSGASVVCGAALLAFAAVACGSSDSSDGGSSTPTGDDDGTPDKVGQPPEPAGEAATGTETRTFALFNLNLGVDTATAQKTGYNVDGVVTSDADNASDTSCVASGKTTPLADGANGIDNAFGQKLAPTIKLLLPDFDSQLNGVIQDGTTTVMFDIKGLEDSATQTNKGLTAQILVGADFGDTKPTFTTGDDWPVRPEFLKDGKTIDGGSKLTFSDAYITNGVFVGRADSISINLSAVGNDLTLTIHKAVVTFRHDGANATEGVISGVLALDEVLGALDKGVGNINDGEFCDTYKSNVSVIESAADIMSDGTNAKGTCSGISIGLSFTAKEIKHPTKVGTAPTSSGAPLACSQR